MFARTVLLLSIGVCLAAGPASANRESTALAVRGAGEMYNLDHDRAMASFEQAVAADPTDARAHRALASELWLSITFHRGNMTVDDYLGKTAKPRQPPPPAPPATVAAFHSEIDRAIALAKERIAANPRDPEGHYQLGSALGLQASYIATVDASVLSAFRAARSAYEAHEKALDLDPARKDAQLVVGTYRYIVSTLALPVRWIAYAAGFGGDKARGIHMIEEAAAFGGDNEQDARFALILIYNREKRYDDALKQLALLRERFPRNRLLWLESGSTSLRAGRPADAETFLTTGLARFADDKRQRMFGEDALWYYKRGATRAALGRAADAQADLRKALSLEGRNWVHGR
jgi:tetratricopeptide (TPR) repeat protein